MSSRTFLPVLTVGLAWATVQSSNRPTLRSASWGRTTVASPLASPLVHGDSIVIDITNNMPHPMTITYEVRGERKPLGAVDAGAERLVAIHDLQGDSVVVWATNGLPPHDIRNTFPTHSTAPLTWSF